MIKGRVRTVRQAMLFAPCYDNGTRTPGPILNWASAHGKPKTIKQIQNIGMRSVPITLAPVPRSKILTDDELK